MLHNRLKLVEKSFFGVQMSRKFCAFLNGMDVNGIRPVDYILNSWTVASAELLQRTLKRCMVDGGLGLSVVGGRDEDKGGSFSSF